MTLKPTLLYVEDDPSTRQKLKTHFHRKFFHLCNIKVVSSAEDCLNLLGNQEKMPLNIFLIILSQNVLASSVKKLLKKIYQCSPQSQIIFFVDKTYLEKKESYKSDDINFYCYFCPPWNSALIDCAVSAALTGYSKHLISSKNLINRNLINRNPIHNDKQLQISQILYLQIKRQDLLLDTLLDTGDEAFFVVNHQGKIVRYSKRMLRFFNCTEPSFSSSGSHQKQQVIKNRISLLASGWKKCLSDICNSSSALGNEDGNSNTYYLLSLSNNKTDKRCSLNQPRIGDQLFDYSWELRGSMEMCMSDRLNPAYALNTATKNVKFSTSNGSDKRSQLFGFRKLEDELYQSLDNGELCLYYQPQIDTWTGKVTHVESLVRWRHPQIGMVSPKNFIPIAEKNGFIGEITQWGLKEACSQAKRWQTQGLEPIVVSVNLSPRQYLKASLVDDTKRILEQLNLPPNCLELEITEAAAVLDLERTGNTLKKFQDLGVAIALDDFGTGYSALNYVKKLPFNTLKLDRFAITKLLSDSREREIIQLILELGQRLDCRVVAEGVETIALRDTLSQLGCRFMQGHLFSCPIPVEKMSRFLKRNQESSLSRASFSLNMAGGSERSHNVA